MQSYDIPLHDIKPIVDVDEYSLYYFLGLSGLGLLLTLLFVYIIYFFYKKSKVINIKKHNLESLESLDVTDTKNTAYAINTYGSVFKNDSPEHQEMYEILTKKLEEYKYKKSVDTFDEETLELIASYKALLRV